MKKIWIVNYYTTPPAYVSNPRHLEFADKLIKAGFDVTIFCSGFIREANIDLTGNDKYVQTIYNNQKFVHIKVKHYIGNGIDRMLSILQFAFRLFKYRKHFDKPDIIFHNIHAPFDYPVYWCAKRLKAIYIVEAWDLWPESFVRFGLIKAQNPLVQIAFALEKRLYEKADKIIFTFEGGIDYLKKQHWTLSTGGKIDENKVFYINNGVNIEQFNNDINLFQLNDSDLTNPNNFNVVYMGSISLVNNIKQLIDAANILKNNSRIKFLIFGNGSERDILERYCQENQITNVVFKEKRILLSYVPYVLSKSSLNILNYQKNFGLYGVSSGKLFQYFAAGKPICANIAMNYCLIQRNRLGIAKNLETPEEYANAILSIVELSDAEYKNICNRVKETSKIFDYEVLSNALIEIINK